MHPEQSNFAFIIRGSIKISKYDRLRFRKMDNSFCHLFFQTYKEYVIVFESKVSVNDKHGMLFKF